MSFSRTEGDGTSGPTAEGARRVLMISPHFPPDGSAAAHRVRLLAPHLPAYGWEPTVLTLTPGSYGASVDPGLASLVPARLDVRRVAAWPAAITRPFGVGDLGLRALLPIRRAAGAALARRTYRALFITVYPVYPALLGPALKRRYRVPFVLDYQDPWVGSWGLTVGGGPGGTPDLKSRATRRAGLLLEPRVVRNADAVTAVSARTYEDVLARIRPAHDPVVAALPLGWEAADRRAADTISNRWFDRGDGRVHLCYVGTLLPNGIATAAALLAAVGRLRDTRPDAYRDLRLHFFGTSNQFGGGEPRALPLAREHGVAEIVDEHPDRVPYLEALRILSDATAILLLGSTEPHYTASKIFPALLAGRPILALFHEASSVNAILRSAGPEPAVRLLAYRDVPDVSEVFPMLRDTVLTGSTARGPSDLSPIAHVSARALAGELARVLDEVSCPRTAVASV